MIRVMRIEDYEAVHAFWLSIEGMGLRSLDDSKEGIERFLKRNPTSCFVKEEQGLLIGCIMAGHDGRRGYIYHAAVHPEFRGKGYGIALVDHALDALKKDGINKACLVVFSANELGNTFWKRYGFATREDLTYRNISLNDLNL
ncbi:MULTISPECIES: GNAT family N-acetyltransferase [unclassified Fusibacter]|uniref:GNAT family N-acetyltransferase n=1 Tax=unclassified Fusibacter TaxID=2624464 RepID=UPI00101088FE|nr:MULTISPECIES: GNAT family N-acetyltransferase [unclassified Fusibacter]MCK8059313.1 GNAT family N-acetyltransferase [Fusibacter sp. A2]RXV62491.1 GNAT family N-acetyltransferase [Fusibacter sp. A1]